MIRHPGCSPSTAGPRLAGLLFSILLVCTLFPAGTLSRWECDYRERQGIQHPEVRPHIEVPPAVDSCSEARADMRWSGLPCGSEGAKEQSVKQPTVPMEKKQ